MVHPPPKSVRRQAEIRYTKTRARGAGHDRGCFSYVRKLASACEIVNTQLGVTRRFDGRRERSADASEVSVSWSRRGCWWRRCSRQTARPSTSGGCGVVVRRITPYTTLSPSYSLPALLKLSVITVISPINRLARAAAPPALFDPTFPSYLPRLPFHTTEPRERQPTNQPTNQSTYPPLSRPRVCQTMRLSSNRPTLLLLYDTLSLSLPPCAVCATVCTRLNALPSTIPLLRCTSVAILALLSSSHRFVPALRPFDFARVNATTLARVTRATRNPTSGFANDARTPSMYSTVYTERVLERVG